MLSIPEIIKRLEKDKDSAHCAVIRAGEGTEIWGFYRGLETGYRDAIALLKGDIE